MYDIYRHPKTKKYQAVKLGFCWPVFFLQSLWAFSKRLYLFGIVLSMLMIFLLAIELLISPQTYFMELFVSTIQIAFYAAIALYANDIRRWFLSFKGYQKKATIDAEWPSAAIEQYIDSSLTRSSA